MQERQGFTWIGRLAVAGLLGAAAFGAQAAPANALERGKQFVEGIAACGNCHGVRDDKGQPLPARGLSGGMLFDDGPLKAYASNITPDAETGIGRWSDAQLARAIREGVRPDGRLIGPPMPTAYYRKMSDADLAGVIAYLRAQPAVRNVVPASRYQMPLPPSWGPPVTSVKAPPPTDTLRWGKYLADMGHCLDCHTPMLPNGQHDASRAGAGGMVFNGPWGQSVARNLTPHPTGLKGWSDAQIAKAIREGVDRNGQAYRPPMGFTYYRNISDADMKALITYLRSLKPVATQG